MNLFDFLNRGTGHAAILQTRAAEKRAAAVVTAAEQTRRRWIGALVVDQTRAFMSVGQPDLQALTGISIMLTIAGFCLSSAGESVDSPDVRVFRGAISAAAQCSRRGAVLSSEDALAFRSAAIRATAVIRAASTQAIVHAAQTIRLTVGIADSYAPGARAATGVVVAAL